ncbi:hypothetical protein BAE44_0001497 [Dichanthelium oligosanthes]|uniref:Uncharacterized protein n=1 Tax=Dichanthelium oligosanthes TaxID=888268 RepID=A0A1E5WJF3_9POAL|nr:hypothetical protein BAE44_0001497 [Dichanthelium oligosanthes]
MDRMRRIAGMGKARVPSAVQKDKDESIVFFRELYKREKDRDVNLLEPMYSVEFDAIQGKMFGYGDPFSYAYLLNSFPGPFSNVMDLFYFYNNGFGVLGDHACRVPSGPSGKRDFLIPVDEKHDYDWLKTAPATPLFPSLEIEANSSQMAFQKELPIPPRQLSGKPEATKTSARSASPTANSSSKKTFAKAAPAIPKEKKQPYTAGQRSSHKVPVNGHQKATTAAIPGTRTGGAPKKHSERCYASQTGGTSATKGVTDQEIPFKAPKNLITTTRSIFRRHTPSPENARGSKDPVSGVDVKKENGKARRQSCPPAAIRGMTELRLQDRRDALPPRGKYVTGSSGETASGTGGRAGRATLTRDTGRTAGRSWI